MISLKLYMVWDIASNKVPNLKVPCPWRWSDELLDLARFIRRQHRPNSFCCFSPGALPQANRCSRHFDADSAQAKKPSGPIRPSPIFAKSCGLGCVVSSLTWECWWLRRWSLNSRLGQGMRLWLIGFILVVIFIYIIFTDWPVDHSWYMQKAL